MVEELRAEQPPELPWDAIEPRLLGEIERREGRRSTTPARAPLLIPILPRPGSELARAFALAAVAAGILLGGLAAGSGERWRAEAAPRRAVEAARVALAPGAAGARGERELLSLHPGDVIDAADAPLTFSHEGAAAWTLAPGGRVVVRSIGKDGLGHIVELERGSIHAEVTPREPAEGLVEAFAVEVENTRVAVHGTAFSVTRDEERVIVDVEHGAVAVGPKGHVGVTTGHLLIGPKRASFSLDGGRLASVLPRAAAAAPPLVAAAPSAPPIEPTDPAPGAAAPVAAREAHAPGPVHALAQRAAPPEPPAPLVASAPALLSVASVRASLARCFEKVYEGGSASVEVSISSTLHIVRKGDGSVQSARFDPPLKPAFQVCAGSALAGRFAEGEGAIDIPITLKR